MEAALSKGLHQTPSPMLSRDLALGRKKNEKIYHVFDYDSWEAKKGQHNNKRIRGGVCE